jgi:putative PIN family toxin of toxin-antitoxin system
MIIVLDTNVLVSGLLKGNSNPGMIVRMVAAGKLKLAYDSRILDEYKEVLARPKFEISKNEISIIISQIEAEGELVTGEPLEIQLPDPDDNTFVEIARATSKKVLVTGNKNHFPASLCKEINVYNPAEFLDFWLGSCNEV